MKNFILPLILVITIQILPKNLKAQIVNSLESEARGEEGKSNDEEAVEFLEAFGSIFWNSTCGMLIGFEGEPSLGAIDFAKYPYENSNVGMFLPINKDGYRARGQLLGHFQSNGNALHGGYFQIKYSPWQFLAVDVNHLQLYETVENSENKSDRLGITNFNIQYNRIRSKAIHGWWGLGLTKFRTNEVDYLSPNFSIGTTIYIHKPVSLHAELTAAYPYNAIMIQSQVRAQVHFKRYMIYGGYQGIKVGDVFEPNWTIGMGVHF